MKNKRLSKLFFGVFMALCFLLVNSKYGSVLAASLTSENVLKDVNQARIQNGVPALKTNGKLALAAERKGQDMIKYGYWAHTNPVTGETPWKIIAATGYKARYMAENLAKDYNDTTVLVSAWTASPTHRGNMLATKYKETGIAVVRGVVNGQDRVIIVQEFGGI